MAYEVRNRIDEEVKELYGYGSKVYKTYREGISDEDYIAVVDGDTEFDYNFESEYMKDSNVHVICYSEALFIKHIREHKVSILECIFQHKDDKYVNYFELDAEKLRVAFSSVASNSYCKAKKKMKEGDIYIAKKSLFHSLRILDFGIQIAIHGKIVNYQSSNYLYEAIMSNESTDWSDYHSTYLPIFNRLKTGFKKLAPIDKER